MQTCSLVNTVSTGESFEISDFTQIIQWSDGIYRRARIERDYMHAYATRLRKANDTKASLFQEEEDHAAPDLKAMTDGNRATEGRPAQKSDLPLSSRQVQSYLPSHASLLLQGPVPWVCTLCSRGHLFFSGALKCHPSACWHCCSGTLPPKDNMLVMLFR